MVSFETIGNTLRHNDGTAPVGWGFVQSHGWSSQTILAHKDHDWFRHPAVFGFFDHFDQVLFYRAGAAGYAAAVFSVAAPNAKVLAIQPQAILSTARAETPGSPEARHMDLDSRFGFAPMMVETASQVWVTHDPSVIEDAMHASLFDGPNTAHLSCHYTGPDAQRHFMAIDVLPDLLEQAMDDTLTAHSYAQPWRTRHTHLPYLRALTARLEAEGRHDRLLARLCRVCSDGGRRPMFAKKLAELEARGITL
jgi:hypothetical protein